MHRQYLVAKVLGLKLNHSLNIIIRTVNKIKRSSLSESMFSKVCDDNYETYNHLLLHTEVRWKSKGNCLVRFHELYSILEHVETIDVQLHGELENVKYDLTYLSDIFGYLNINNKSLQG